MLRISTVPRAKGVTVHLEGRLVAPWVDELERALATTDPACLRLKLGGLVFADEQGLALLRSLQAAGARLIECSPFLKELLAQAT
jgi:hypothetical protein